MTQDLRRWGHFQAPSAEPLEKGISQQNKNTCWRLVGSGEIDASDSLAIVRRVILNVVSAYPEVSGGQLDIALTACRREVQVRRHLRQQARGWTLGFDRVSGRCVPDAAAEQAAWVRDYVGRQRNWAAAKVFGVVCEAESVGAALHELETLAALVELGRDAAGLDECAGCALSTLDFEEALKAARERVRVRVEAVASKGAK